MKKNSFPIIITIIIAVAISMIYSFSPEIEIGRLQYKLITGTVSDTSKIVLINSPGHISTTDNRLNEHISGKDENLFLNDELDSTISAHYTDVKYQICMELCGSRNDKEIFEVNRAVLNRIKFNRITKFEIDKSNRDIIKKLIIY